MTGLYSRNNLLNIKDVTYVINLDKYKSIGIPWIALHVNGNIGSASYDVTYLDSFWDEHIPKEIRKFVGNKNIIINTFELDLLILCLNVKTVLHQFVIPTPICNLCPDLKSLLPHFVISSPIWNIFSPVCNLFAPTWHP